MVLDMSSNVDFEVVEPKPKATDCKCASCGDALVSKLTEDMMHIYVGSNAANDEREIEDFQEELTFASVIYWDVGYSGSERYLIYADEFGDAVAWYDQINGEGFKPAIVEVQPSF